MNFENKVILITGASSGIGKAIAKELVKYNCKLILTARRLDVLNEIKRELGISDDRILVLKCDVGNIEDVTAANKKIKERFGLIDIALLNAGIGRNVTIENYRSKDAEDIINANFMGLVNWVEQLLPDFLKRKQGIIVGVSSLADNRGFSGSGFYCASKAAATIYLEGLRVELKPYGIKVITVKPGFVRTPMTDQNNFKMLFLMEPEKAASIIVEGVKKEKRIIQFPWQTVLLTKLVGLLPGSFYEYLASKVKVK